MRARDLRELLADVPDDYPVVVCVGSRSALHRDVLAVERESGRQLTLDLSAYRGPVVVLVAQKLPGGQV